MSFLIHLLWAAGALILFGLAIIIHEFGHFLAAKLLGFKVDAFSIGFGPAIWHKTIKGCDYRVCWIPLGGYVALPQLDPSSMDEIQGEHGEKDEREKLAPVPAWKRIVVAFAGPFGNVVLAVVLAFIIAAAPSDFGGIGVTVGEVEKGGVAEQAGLQVGDRFLTVNGNEVAFWTEVLVECHLAGDTNKGVVAVIDRGGEQIDLKLPIQMDPSTGYLTLPGVSPRLKCQIDTVTAGSPAEAAGLKQGDTILEMNGVAINSPHDMVTRLSKNKGTPAEFTVKRFPSEETEKITLLPQYNAKHHRIMIGIVFSSDEMKMPQWMAYRRPWLQLKNDAKSIFRMLRALFAPKAKGEATRAAKDMGGALTLFYIFWVQVQAGLLQSLAFLRFLCINLAILNLLPLPILDGGHIAFAIVEIISGRKPSERFVNAISTIFAFLLIGLMALLIYRDALRFKKMHDRNVQMKAELEQEEKGHPELASEGITNSPKDWASLPAETNAPAMAPEGESPENGR